MFLAWQEIKHSPWRYISIAAVVFLVSYLVYFLTGLAWGLAASYTEAIKPWKANSITVTEASNKNALASRIPREKLEIPQDSAALTMTVAAVEDLQEQDQQDQNSDSEDDSPTARVDTYVFAIDPDRFLAPEVVEGDPLSGSGEAVVDAKLKRAGYQLGDDILLPQAQDPVRIVGFSKQTRFQTAPVIYVDDEDVDALLGQGTSRFVSVVVNRGDDRPSADADLESVSESVFIDNLPGYRAQYLTFSLMVGSMILILSLVLGIFMYVLTLQKKTIFGIMKARGISTAYIARAGAYQTLMVSTAGVLAGLGAAAASGLALADTAPFAINTWLFALVTAAFILFTLVGSLFPIRVISKIDPVKAIG
ncbi:MAG: ABC transporter permease [Actinomycetaceae bacterium]|nr:ABC transporter permease [Actinomycetaceae bacterium]